MKCQYNKKKKCSLEFCFKHSNGKCKKELVCKFGGMAKHKDKWYFISPYNIEHKGPYFDETELMTRIARAAAITANNNDKLNQDFFNNGK